MMTPYTSPTAHRIIEYRGNKYKHNAMSATAWEEIIIVIYFVYGLAFYSMGLALLVESGRASELGFARSMRLLAGFGLLHGIHEWIDMSEVALELYHNSPLPLMLMWLRLAILVASFLALMAFGENLLKRKPDRRRPYWRLTVGAALWYGISCVVVQITYQLNELAWIQAADVLSRYILGIPGSVLACWALWHERTVFRERGMSLFVRDLTVAAIAMALYGIVGQFFTRASVIFPSMVLNSELFLQITGFPIQLLRAGMAALVAISMIRVLRALEVENQQRLDAADSARRQAEELSREELARLNAELQAANEQTAHLLHEVQERDAMRGELIQRITAAQESERKQIARELHDGTGQALTGLALGLRGVASQTTREPAVIAQRLGVLETMATTSLGELRHLINDLRPPQLDDMGLAAALRWLVDRFRDSDNKDAPSLQLDVRGDAVPLPAEVETTVFRIAQEGLTNAIRHARAKHISVTLDYADGPSLVIRDDGVGFDPIERMRPNGARTAWGLRGMQERANLINAVLNVESSPGGGATFTVRLHQNRQVEHGN